MIEFPAIIHGDSREVAADLLAQCPPIDCLLTDPPYGVAYQSTFGKDPKAREKYQQKIMDDGDVDTAIQSFDEVLHATVPFMAEDCEIYIFSTWTVAPEWQMYLRDLDDTYGLRLMMQLIWEKGYPGLGDFTYNWGCGYEVIFYMKKGNRPVPYRRSAVLAFDRVPSGQNIHPTEKPQTLLGTLINYSTVAGDFVFDPYSGSGSTVLAAAGAGRKALGIERDERYIDAARSRLPGKSLFDLLG